MTTSNTDELVERLRTGVRQARAARTIQGDPGTSAGLAELYRYQTLVERSPRSHRRILGPLVVAARTLVRKLFLGWYIDPIIQQQSLYNLAATRAIQGLAEENEKLRRDHAALESELERLRVGLGPPGPHPEANGSRSGPDGPQPRPDGPQ